VAAEPLGTAQLYKSAIRLDTYVCGLQHREKLLLERMRGMMGFGVCPRTCAVPEGTRLILSSLPRARARGSPQCRRSAARFSELQLQRLQILPEVGSQVVALEGEFHSGF